MTNSPILLVHGGCGVKRPTTHQVRIIKKVVGVGYALLQQGASAVDAVEAAVVELERSGRFNAGKGSRRQMDGVVRMDASIMDGRDLAAGAVAAMEGILTPIRAARLVMERTPHVLLAGRHAQQLARRYKLERLPPGGRRRRGDTASRQSLWGTVGAVARDRQGHLAAATSTGGIRLMLPGRVGDSPLIGAGTYADDRSGAVSMTGEGEAIIRAGLAKEICLLMEQGLSPLAAGQRALRRMRQRTHGHAGAIIVSRSGSFAILHTTPHMIAASSTSFEGRRGVTKHSRLRLL